MILVSKDINLRLKARALNLASEDYETVKIKDLDHLPKGKNEVEVADPASIDRLYQEEWLPVEAVLEGRPPGNQYFILRCGSKSALAFYNPRTDRIERVHKPLAYGISPRNAEQTFALHAVMNMDVPLVTLSGAAGTGKTLIALAGALEQRRHFRQIYLARPIVPLSNRDIGFLPGDVHSKINPFMQPLWDNLGIIKNQFDEKEREYKKVDEHGGDREAPHRPAGLHPRPQPLERHLHRGRGPEPHPPRGQDDHHPGGRAHQDRFDR